MVYDLEPLKDLFLASVIVPIEKNDFTHIKTPPVYAEFWLRPLSPSLLEKERGEAPRKKGRGKKIELVVKHLLNYTHITKI